MPGLLLRRYEQILQQEINTVVARTAGLPNPLNDLTDSSIFKHVLAATARALDEAYYQLGRIPDLFSLDTAVGDDLDQRAREIQPALLARRQAVKATGTVIFSRTGTSGTVTVPGSTSVKTVAGVTFLTTVSGQILDTFSSSAPVPVVAAVAGAAGNVAINTITKFDAKPAGVETVTNPATLVGGADPESDDAFRARIRAFIATLARCTPEALEFISKGIQISSGKRVVYSHVFEDPIDRGEVVLYVDDGAGTAEETASVTAELLTQGLAGPPADSCVGGEQFLFTNQKPVRRASPFTLVSGGGPGHGALVEGTHYLLDDPAGQVYLLPSHAFYAPRPGYPQGGASTGETFTFTYAHYTGLVQAVQKVVDGDPADRTNYPGWRAAGVRVRVRVPVVLQQVVQASVLVAEGYVKGVPIGGGLYTAGSVLEAVQQALSAYVNGLGISGDVILSELIAAIMSVPGVTNCQVLAPLNDTVMLDDQLPRLTAPNTVLS